MVENRDLISTYVPLRGGASDSVLGVVELHSDITPFLVQIKAASQRFASITAANDAEVRRKSGDYLARLQASLSEFLLIVIGLLALLHGVSLLIVRHGQRQIDRQTLAQEDAARREQLWHREKMAALATMAANVSHEVGNPLAVIAGMAQQLPATTAADSGEPVARTILAQTARVSAMMRQISDFASARSEAADCVDVNAMLKALCDFHAFDRRFKATPIDFRPGSGLPACQLVPDHLNEAMMNLLQVMADARPPGVEPVPLCVQTEATTCGVRIRVGLDLPVAAQASLAGLDAALAVDPRMEALRRCVAGMRGQLTLGEGQVQITVPGVPDGEA